MPRSGGGVYSAPVGTTAVTLTPIESAPYNTLIADLVADANAARPISAGGTGAANAADARTNLGLSYGTITQNANYTPAGTDAVTTTIQTRLRDEVRLRDFTRGINDPALRLVAVQAALDAAKAVTVDEETVEVSSTIVLRPQTSLIGKGRFVSRFKLVRPGQVFVPLIYGPSSAVDVSLKGIGFDHDGANMIQATLANQVAFAWACAVLLGGQDSTIDDCAFFNAWDTGVALGAFAVTGDGSGGDPFTAIQTTSAPQTFSITNIYGESNGVGNHNAFGELGLKGSIVNVLTASDGRINGVTGRANYGGVIVDFGGGGECAISNVAITGTLLDALYPSNGSGIDCYIGSGPTVLSNFMSHNSGRQGLAISPDAGKVALSNVMIHAAQNDGAVIEGGLVTGDITTTECSQSGIAAFDGVRVNASAAVELFLKVTSKGSRHRYGYASTLNGGSVAGLVDVYSIGHSTGAFFRAGSESLRHATGTQAAYYGPQGFGTIPPSNTQSTITAANDLSLVGATAGIGFNLYFDTASSGWKYTANGHGVLVRLEPAGGLQYYTAPNNTSGPGASATLTPAAFP